jgi:hypothetical protein
VIIAAIMKCDLKLAMLAVITLLLRSAASAASILLPYLDSQPEISALARAYNTTHANVTITRLSCSEFRTKCSNLAVIPGNIYVSIDPNPLKRSTRPFTADSLDQLAFWAASDNLPDGPRDLGLAASRLTATILSLVGSHTDPDFIRGRQLLAKLAPPLVHGELAFWTVSNTTRSHPTELFSQIIHSGRRSLSKSIPIAFTRDAFSTVISSLDRPLLMKPGRSIRKALVHVGNEQQISQQVGNTIDIVEYQRVSVDSIERPRLARAICRNSEMECVALVDFPTGRVVRIDDVNRLLGSDGGFEEIWNEVGVDRKWEGGLWMAALVDWERWAFCGTTAFVVVLLVVLRWIDMDNEIPDNRVPKKARKAA